jgi:hypothetical protein
METMRWSCRRIAHTIEKRERIEGGTSQSPRTRTSSVPVGQLGHRLYIQK